MKGLIWFRHDLRVADNPALATLSRHCNKALMVYVIDPQWFNETPFQTKRMGRFREEFLYQSLLALEKELKKYQQKLIIKIGNGTQIIAELCKKHRIDLVTITDHPGVYERQQVAILKKTLSCELVTSESFSLYLQHQFSFNQQTFPQTFGEFTQHVEHQHLLPSIPICAPALLPECIDERKDYWSGQELFYDLSPYHGGEDASVVQLNQYFWKTDGLKHHVKTKDQLEGWQFSSKLSAWLANGSLSVRFIAAELDKYQYRYGSSASTKILFSQLLLREYFQWMMHHFGTKMFASKKINNINHHDLHFNEKFSAWKHGTTSFPMVNACMRQLNQTGFMSNRGRKVVASCLLNELGIDWRFGAAYFEQQLIDFDVALNYGNWQHLGNFGAKYLDIQSINLDIPDAEADSDCIFVARWSSVTPPESLLR